MKYMWLLAAFLPVTPLWFWRHWVLTQPQKLTVCRDHVLEAPNHCEDGARLGAVAHSQFIGGGNAYIVCVCPESTGVVFWK